MEAISSPTTSVDFYRDTQNYNLEGRTPYSNSCDKLKSKINQEWIKSKVICKNPNVYQLHFLSCQVGKSMLGKNKQTIITIAPALT
jgi:hypothetical protein